MKMKHILTSPFLALSIVASAQTVTLDITWRDTTVIGADMTYAQAKTRWPAWVGYMEYIGASSKVLNIRKAVASHNNAVWANDDYAGVTYYQNGCGSRANIIWPHGAFFIDAELIKTQGIVKGDGTQGFWEWRRVNNDPTKPLFLYFGGSGGTTLIYDHAGWDGVGNHAGIGGDASKRFIFKDQTWGRIDNFGYTEGAQLEHFKIWGRSNDLHDPSYHFSAVGVWKAGEDYTIESVFIYSANNYGIEMGGQFHATYHSTRVSVFKCGLGAYGVEGGAHMQVNMGSYDDNPAVFHVYPGANGSIGNGTAIKCFGTKFETGKTDARPYSRGQMLVDGEGWIKFDAYGTYFSRVNTKPHALFRIKSVGAPGNGAQESRVYFSGVTWFYTPAYLLHDRAKGEIIPMDVPWNSNVVNSRLIDFLWTSERGVLESTGQTLTPVPATCDGRLAPSPVTGYTPQAQGSNPIFKPWSGCSPAYSYTSPIQEEGGPVTPPPTGNPCTYTTGPWSACTNGTQTRTVTATPSGCTGTPPPSSQPCTVTPPPVLTIKWASTFSGTNGCTLVATTGTNITQATSWACGAITGGKITTNRCTSFPLAMAATRVVLVGVTFNSWEEWGWLNSAIRTRANGDLQDGTGKVLATVVKGAKVDRLTLDLSPGTTLQSVIGPADRNTCGTAVMTVEAVEVY